MADDKEKVPLKSDRGLENGKAVSDPCPEFTSGPPVPPDGGYGWVIMCASFFVNFLVDGVCFSFGIFFLEFLEEFNEGKETTSWVGSVLNGMYLSMGPVVGALANKFGCRTIAITGSIVASGSLILSTFSPNVYVLIITYGLLTGAGFGLMYLPAIVMVGYYFEKRRALATGIAVCGSGIGGFVFAPMCEKLIEAYSWRGATWIIAAICLNGIVCGALFRPLEPTRRRARTLSHSKEVAPAEKVPCDKLVMEKESDVKNVAMSREPKDILMGKIKHSLTSDAVKSGTDGNCDDACTRSLHDLTPSGTDACHRPSVSMSCDDLRVRRKKCLSESAATGSTKAAPEDLLRPMYRKDVLYSGSIQNLPQYKQSGNMEEYIKSVTSVPDAGADKGTPGPCESLASTLKEMMDFSLLKNPVFCIYGVSCFLCMTGFFVPFTYLPDMGVSYGSDKGQAAFLISIIGIANTVARVLCGWVSDQPWADCLLINNCALVLGGVTTMLCPFCYYYGLLGTYSFVFGSCIAAFVSLRSIIMVELMGLEKLTNAFGLVTLCQGLSSFIGAPIAGALFDATGYYNLSFYVAGSTLALAGIICFPLRKIALWRKKKNLLQNIEGSTVTGSDEVNIMLSEQKSLVNKSGNGQSNA